MDFDEPEGRDPEKVELAQWSSTDSGSGSGSNSDSDTDDEGVVPSGYIIVKLQIKKKYKTILSEEELL